MICNLCSNVEICKHYDYIKNNVGVTMVVNKCNNYRKLSNEVSENAYVPPTTTLLNTTKDISRDFRELSNKVNNDRVNNDFKVTSVPTELSECDNENCKASTYEDDKSFCTICGDPVCPVCSYSDIYTIGETKTENIATICEKCYNESEIINNIKHKKEATKTFKIFDINMFKENENE